MSQRAPIVFIGFKGCGKSTVGRLVAERIGTAFADTDQLLQDIYFERENKRLHFREIFQKHGRAYFSSLEIAALKRSVDEGTGVISFGGGTLLVSPKSGVNLKNAIYVLLKVERDALYERLEKDGFPAFFDLDNPRKSFEDFYVNRLPIYKRFADITVNNGSREAIDTAEEVVESLIKDFGYKERQADGR